MRAPLKELKVNIEPVQDLHGYDHPWPAGGGKNKLNATPNTVKPLNTHGTWNGNSYTDNGVTFAISDDGIITVNGTATNTTYFELGSFETGAVDYVLNGLVGTYQNVCSLVGISGSWYSVRDAQGVTLPQSATVRICVYVATGAALTNYIFKPMIRLSSVTDATFAPYSNICPISGWTGANVTRAGKNLLNLTADSPAYNINTGYDATIKRTQLEPGAIFIGVSSNNYWIGETTNRYIIAKGNGSISYRTNDAAYGFGVCAEVKPLADYTVSAEGSGYAVRIALYGQDGSWIKAINNNQTFTTTADAKYALIIFCCTSDTKNTDIAVSDIQLKLSSVSTDYSAYSGQTINVEFPSEAGTVYGGELTVNEDGTGVLKVDLGITDLGETTIIYNDGYNYPYFSLNMPSDSVTGSSALKPLSVYCQMYKTLHNMSGNIFRTNDYNCSMCLNSAVSTRRLLIQDNRFSSEESLRSAITGVPFIYELATPTTYTLTASQVRTLLGTNHVWSDVGNIELSYWTHTH